MARLIRLACVLILAAGSLRAQSNSLDSILSGLRQQPMNPVLLREMKAAVPGVTDPALRCRLGVLYTLGSFAAGNRDEGLAVRAAVRKAYPASDLLQDLADERISRACADCEAGSVLDPCPACGGTGRCPVCKGKGQQEVPGMGSDPRTVKCMHCTDRPGKCRTCSGTKGYPKPCPTCGGTALVLAPEKANVLYMRMLRAMAPVEAKGPVIVVVTAAPPEQVAVDTDALRAEQVGRAVAAAKEQAAASPLLQKYPLTADAIRSVKNPELTPAQREELLAGLAKQGLAHPTRGRFFFLPFPAGLTYCVADVVKNPYGGYFLKLTSTPPKSRKGTPVELTSREVLDEAARAICEPLGSFLSDPTLCVPDGDPRTGALRKGEVIESGAWLIPVQLSHWGAFDKVGTSYRSPDEMMTQLGFSR